MSTLGPVVRYPSGLLGLHPSGVPSGCRGRIRERSRLEWRIADGGEPLALVERFLAEHGLPVADLSRQRSVIEHDTESTCGAAVLLCGGTPGPPSPAPAVPDVVVIVYEHRAAVGTEPPVPVSRIASTVPWRIGPWRASWSQGRHAAAVSAVREAIARGDVYQVNLVGHASAPCSGDPAAALARVAGLAGARYGGVLRGADWSVACASPETLVEVDGGRVITRPIKGTRPATGVGRVELLASAKERAEHVMIVDLERNDLARVAAIGTVRVDELFALRRWSGLWQAESTVSARLADGVGLAALLGAVWPGGSVTGAPKLAAMDVIAKLEPVGRGPSMGALGWVAADRIDLGLTIRTVAVESAGSTGRVHVWAGGGITWGSDPQAEVAEAAAKAGPIRAALAGPS